MKLMPNTSGCFEQFFLESLSISSQEQLEGERYQIVLDDQLKKGKSYVLSLQFQGKLSSHLQGFYQSHYTTLSGDSRFATVKH